MAHNRPGDCVDRDHTIHAFEHAFAGVVVDKGCCLGLVGRQTSLKNFRIVIRADLFAASGHFSHPLFDALKENTLIDFQLDDRIKLEAAFSQEAVERFRLRYSAWKTVKHEAAFRIALPNTVSDDCHDHIIRHEFAAFHDALCAQPNRCTGRNRGTQHVACGELNNSVFGYQALRLRAFPAPGGPSRINLIASDLATWSA
jgi:hypothetical protein